jgi:hypothetical protein
LSGENALIAPKAAAIWKTSRRFRIEFLAGGRALCASFFLLSVIWLRSAFEPIPLRLGK